MTVRQSDAHAWSEVWLQGRGWSRVDPTAVVAPARVDPAAEAARTGELARNPVFGNADWLRAVALQLGGRAEQLAPVGAVLLAGAPARAGGNAGAGAALGERRHRAGGARRPPRRRHGSGVDAFARRARSAGRHLPAAEGQAAARGRRCRRLLRAARAPRAQRARPAARRRASRPGNCWPATKACDIRAAPKALRPPTFAHCAARYAPSNPPRIPNENPGRETSQPCRLRWPPRSSRPRRRAVPRGRRTPRVPRCSSSSTRSSREHGFDRERVERWLNAARYSPTVERLMQPPIPFGQRNWLEYRSRYLEDKRVQAGVDFWRGNAAALERATERFGVPPESHRRDHRRRDVLGPHHRELPHDRRAGDAVVRLPAPRGLLPQGTRRTAAARARAGHGSAAVQGVVCRRDRPAAVHAGLDPPLRRRLRRRRPDRPRGQRDRRDRVGRQLPGPARLAARVCRSCSRPRRTRRSSTRWAAASLRPRPGPTP